MLESPEDQESFELEEIPDELDKFKDRSIQEGGLFHYSFLISLSIQESGLFKRAVLSPAYGIFISHFFRCFYQFLP